MNDQNNGLIHQFGYEITREENIAAQLNLQDLCSDIRMLMDEKNTIADQNKEYEMKLKKQTELYQNMKEDYENRINSVENEKTLAESSLYEELKKNTETIQMKTHLQSVNQNLMKRVEELNMLNLDLKLKLEQATSDTNLKRENENIKIQCDRMLCNMKVLFAETTSVNKRIDNTFKLTQVLTNEHHNIKQRYNKTNALYLNYKQRIEELETKIANYDIEVNRLKSLQHETKRARDHSKLVNENLMQEIKQKDAINRKLQVEVNNNNKTLEYVLKMQKKTQNNVNSFKDLLHEYENDINTMKHLRENDAKTIDMKDKEIHDTIEKYEKIFEKMQIENVVEDLINKTVCEIIVLN